MSEPVVLLATCAELPEGEPGGGLLPEALRERGVRARWVAWDDPAVDWSEGLVCVRATWDYEHRREEFLAWAAQVPRLLNSAAVFAWNTDKSYLAGLADRGLPIVPSTLVADESELAPAVAEHFPAVVKPAIGAGGRGVVVFDGESGGVPDLDESLLEPGPWIVQPLVDSVRTEGETSVFVLGGRAVSQARKLPAGGEIRVHEEYGGRTEPAELTHEAAQLAERTVRAAEELLGERIDYGRVDQMRLPDGRLVVSELEATEPGLYLLELPGNAAAFAELVRTRLA